MYARKFYLFALFALLLAGLACSGPGDLLGPQAPETWEYDSSLGLGDDVTSYTADFTVKVSGTDETGTDLDIDFDGSLAAQRDPAAASLQVTTSATYGADTVSADEDYVFIDEMYYSAGDMSGTRECYGSYEEDDVPFTVGEILNYAEMEGAEDFMKDLPDMAYVGEEDGRWHYQGEGDVQIEDGEIQNVVVDVWIDPDTGHVLKLEMTGEISDATSEGDVSYNYELTSVNEEVDIEVPSVCD